MKDLHSVLADLKWTAVVGLFDPLTAVQGRHLADAANGGRKVLAVVLTAPDTLMTADARAELVAAVRGVDAVFVADPDTWQSAIPSNSDLTILDDLPAEKRRSAEFVKFILERQGLN